MTGSAVTSLVEQKNLITWGSVAFRTKCIGMFLLVYLSKSSWFCPATSPPHLSGCDEDALHVGPAEQVKLLDLTGTPRGLATLVSQRLSWCVGCSWGNNFGFKSLFCGNRTRAQTNAESFISSARQSCANSITVAGEGTRPFSSNCFLQAAISQSVLLFPFVHLIAERRDQMLCDKS